MNPLRCGVLLAVFFTPVFSQIAIDWTEIPQNIGIEFTHNGAESVVVNVGSTGGPQVWSFVQPMGSQYADMLIVPRGSTPYGDSFPSANLVMQITSGSYIVYAYSQVAISFMCALGVGIVSPVVFYRFDPADLIPLPTVYGGTRHYYSSFSVPYASNVVIRTDDFGVETIDAYGSVTVPYGTFQCLRVQYYDTLVTTTLVYGIPILVDTTTNIKYDFLAENYGLIAHVLSYAEETNPNFTNAQLLERLTDFSTGIEELQPVAVSDVYCYPNPFTHSTNIRFTIHDTRYTEEELRNSNLEMRKHAYANQNTSGSVGGIPEYQQPELMIYDATGRLVKSYRITPDALRNTLSWHGDDSAGRRLPGGIYFLRLANVGAVFAQKVLLIR